MTPSLREVLTQLEAFEATPLLGRHLDQARALDRAVALLLLRRPDPDLLTRALLRRGELELALGEESAAATLAEAAERARALSAPLHDIKARLLTARALARVGSLTDAQALLQRAEQEAAPHPELALDRALALASLGTPGATDALERALTEEPTADPDPRAAERLAAASLLAEGHSRDAKWLEADRWYARAIAITEKHHVTGAPARLTLSRAASLLRHGRSEEALPLLAQVFEAGTPLLRLGAGLLLSGALLDLERAEEARPVCEATLALAEARRSWLAFSSAAIDLARCAELTDGLDAARDVLTEALATCRESGEPGPLLQARWVELAGG